MSSSLWLSGEMPSSKGLDMTAIAEWIGHLVCGVLGPFLLRCDTGQSVAEVGYLAVGVLVIFAGVRMFLR